MSTDSEDMDLKGFLEHRFSLNTGVIKNKVQSFVRDNKSFLYSPEREELQNIAGKSLLHLQCRYGLETLSWTRLGARTVGVDFDAHAVSQAISLAQETGLDAEFVCNDIYELPQSLTRTFDIVYTAYGTLFWLTDLDKWGQLVARYLAPEGTFYLVEYHPMANLLDENFDVNNPQPPRLCYPYTHRRYKHSSPKFGFSPFEYQGASIWNYALSEVLQALISAGLRITYIKEHEYMFARRFEQMEQDENGLWKWRDPEYHVPLLFSLKATH